MIFGILHLLTCIALVGAAIRWRFTRRSGEGAHKFVFPFVIAATVSGVSILLGEGKDLLRMSDDRTYTVTDIASGYSMDGRLLNLATFLLLILPGFALFPPVGSRPWCVVTLALLSTSPMWLF